MIKLLFILTLLCPALVYAQDVQVNLDSFHVPHSSRVTPQQVEARSPADDILREDNSVRALRLKYGLPLEDKPQVKAVPPKKVPVARVFKPIPAPPVLPQRGASVADIVSEVNEVEVKMEEASSATALSVDEDETMLAPPDDLLSDPAVGVADERFMALLSDLQDDLDAKPEGGIFVAFSYDEIRIEEAAQDGLAEEVLSLRKDLDGMKTAALRVSIYAYASAEGRGEKKAKRVSLSRALQVREFLIENGYDSALIDLYPQGFDPELEAPDSALIILE